MPKFEVDVGGSTYEVDAPNEQTAWNWANITHEKESASKKETTIGGQAKELVKGVVPGTIGLLETAGVGASALLPDEYETKTREFIKGAAEAGRKPFAATPGYEESIGRKLGEGIGSTVPFFAMGPAGVAGRLGAAALGVSAGAGEARQAAEAKGATAEERRTATQFGAPVGLLDMLAPEIGPLKNIITTALARGGVEGATEAAQKIAQNLIAKGVYDPKQDVLAGSGEEGAYGAGIGALTSLIVDLALGRRARGTPSKPAPLSTPDQAPEQPPEQPPLALGMTQPFTPVSLPDGSVAMTQQDLDAYQQAQFENKYAPQPADKLALGLSEPFSPVSLPDGSVALTKADLDAYEQEQFQKKYAPQPNLNTVQPAETPPQLGYSPLPGTPKIAADGTVLLTPEQEFQNRYAPQKKRITTEEWNSMSPEAKDAAMTQAQLQEQERIKAAEEEDQGRRKKQAGFKKSWSTEESESMGLTKTPPAGSEEVIKEEPKELPPSGPATAMTREQYRKDQSTIGKSDHGAMKIDLNSVQDEKQLVSKYGERNVRMLGKLHGINVKDVKSVAKKLLAINENLKTVKGKTAEDFKGINVDGLKDLLKQMGLSGYGNRAQLIQKLTSYEGSVTSAFNDRLQDSKHKMAVLQAVKKGEPVSDEVLKDYHDLTLYARPRDSEMYQNAVKKMAYQMMKGSVGMEIPGIAKSLRDGLDSIQDQREREVTSDVADVLDDYYQKTFADKKEVAAKEKQFTGLDKVAFWRKQAWEKNPLIAFLADKGLYYEKDKPGNLMSEFNAGKQIMISGYGPVFKSSGLKIDDMLPIAIEVGFLPEGATESDLETLIAKAISGQRVDALYKEQGVDETAARYEEGMAKAYSEYEGQEAPQGNPKEVAQGYLDQLRESGVDTSDITEQAYEDTKNQPEDAYHERVAELARKKLGGTETLAQAKGGQKGFTATKEDLKTQAEIKGKTMIGLAEWAVKNAPNKFSKFVGEKVLARLKSLEKMGVTLNFKVEDGNRRPNNLYSASGTTEFVWGLDGNHTVISIAVNGAPVMENQNGYPSGLGYDTIMHELLHAATRGQMRFLASTDPLVKELRSLYNTVVDHFNAEVKAGRVTPFMERIYKRNNNALLNPDELISWGLTDKEMQDFLNNIKVGEKTVMDKIVKLVRELLGIPKPFETALDRLVRTTDKLLESDVKTLANGMVKEGYTLGRKPGQQTLFSKKAQELFGKEEGQDVSNLPAFKRWFKGSKVVDAKGKPLAVYHGSLSKGITEFDTTRVTNRSSKGDVAGTYFTSDRMAAGNFTREFGAKIGTPRGDITEAYLRIENPLNTTAAIKKYQKQGMTFGDAKRKALEALTPENDGIIFDGDSFNPSEYVVFKPNQIKSVRNNGEFSERNDIFERRVGGGQSQPTSKGQEALDILGAMGRGNQEAEPGYAQKIRQSWDNARDNPKATAEAAKTASSKFLDRLETWTFSSDAGLNNAIRREIEDSTLSSQEKIGILLNTSLSQTVHSDAVASLFLQRGGIKYNNELHKWEGVDNASNFVKLSKQLDDLAEKNGLTKQQAELIAHTAFEAKRLRSLVRFNQELDDKIETVRKEAAAKRASSPVAASALSKEASRLQDQRKFISDEQMDMIAPGMELFKVHPELNDVVKTWNEIRTSTVKTLVDTGLWSENEAEEMLSNADYVPFYREEQLENNQGPKEFIRGLQVQAKEKRLKGSSRPVNDIFDNQVRWVQYSINRAVRNRSALALADTAVGVGAAQQVESRQDGNNVVRVWRDGKEQFYSMDDPMFMEAFTGLEAIVIPSWKWASDMANVLRQSVVMYPLFSVAQVPQDSFAAIFSSGLKPQYALRIPVLAVKEFVQTLRGKSKTHEELKNVGAVGVRDFTSAMVRLDAEIYAGLKAPPGVVGKVKYALNHIAMAADNAVRQAVYEASIAQGVSRAEAMEKAFEVFNVRRKGSSKSLALAGQLIPFFNAYLAAQNVAYKTITGRGISPVARQDAFKTLAATTASVMTLSLLYAMLNGDDDDYLKKPATQRDKLLMIPGTGGMSVPLRADLFTMPKIITEHMYLMMTDKGYEDGRKFRDSMKAALGSALLGPTAVPQAIKPLVEVGINYDFFQGRPLVGTYQQKLDTERQFTDSTSELGKILGKTGLVSPIAADHLLRGMFGSAGGLIIYATNPMLHSDPNSPRPSLSERDAIAALPGMSGFMAKSYESALKKDFYTLKEEVDKAANTLNDLKTRSPQEIGGFLENEENLSRVGLQKSVNAIGERLSNIRKAITQTTNSSMPADEKERQIKILRDAEEQMLQGVDVKKLRELGKV